MSVRVKIYEVGFSEDLINSGSAGCLRIFVGIKANENSFVLGLLFFDQLYDVINKFCSRAGCPVTLLV